MSKEKNNSKKPPKHPKKMTHCFLFYYSSLKKIKSNTQENMIGAEIDLLIQCFKCGQSPTLQQISSKDISSEDRAPSLSLGSKLNASNRGTATFLSTHR